MIPRALGLLPLVAGLLLAACGSSSSAPTGAPATTSAALPASAPTIPPASSVPPAPPSPASAVALPAPASALPTAAPLPARATATAAAAAPSARAPHVATADAGASDAGSAAGDAGAPGPALQMAQTIDAVFARSKTYSARFTQKYTMQVTGTVKDSSGVVSIERPSKISFRYNPPSKNRIVSDGITLKIYIAEDSQMFETPMAKTEYPGALSFMMGKGIASSFNFALPPTRYAGAALEGRPLVPNPSYQTVTFLVDTRALGNADVAAMAAVIVLDAQGNKNRFDFQGASQPASFPADEFTFTPPPGTNVTRSQ